MPKTVKDWRTLLRRWWWLLLAVALVSGIEVALPFLRGLLPIDDYLRGILYAVTTMLAFVGRIIVGLIFSGGD